MVHYAHVRSECSRYNTFAAARVAEDVTAFAFVNVALEVHAHDIAALCNIEGSVVHLDANDLMQIRHMLEIPGNLQQMPPYSTPLHGHGCSCMRGERTLRAQAHLMTGASETQAQ